MRQALLALIASVLLLIAVAPPVTSQVDSRTAFRIRYGSALPATCNPNTGDVFFRTATNIGVHECTAANTWTFIGSATAISGSLTATRVPFASAAQTLTDDADFTFTGGNTVTVPTGVFGTSLGVGITPFTKVTVNVAANKNWAMRDDAGLNLYAANDANDAYVLGGVDGDPLALNARSGGSVGVGTASPAFLFDVRGISGITGANGQSTQNALAANTVAAVTAATLTISNLIPAASMVKGVSCRVTTTFDDSSGLTTFSIGDGSDADRWGAGIARTAGTTTTIANFTITSPVYYAAATSIVLTADAGTFNAAGGAGRCTVHYETIGAATS